MAVATYVLVSVLGYPSVAASIAQGMFWLLLLYFLVGVVYVIMHRRSRSAARVAARAADAEVSALLLGRRSPTMVDQPVDEYSAYPPGMSDADANRPGNYPGEQ